MSYFTYPEPARMSRPPRPTWQSLMAGAGSSFQVVLGALEVSGHAIDVRDSRLLRLSAERCTVASGQAIREKRMPYAFVALLKRRNDRINHSIAAWERSL